MILLTLGILSIIITIYFLYECLKQNESFNNIAEKEYIEEEDWEKYYQNRNKNINSNIGVSNLPVSNIIKLDKTDNSLVTDKVDNNINNNKINLGIQMKKCKNITSCDEIDSNPGCGYCSSTNNFAKGDENGPFDDVCPKDKWSLNKQDCQKKKDKEVCINATQCGDLVGDIKNKCAYCPTTGKIVPYKIVDGKAVSKYGEDVCDYPGGLVTGDNCGTFQEQHPCITPFKTSGPHSEACLKKIWKNSGCTNEKVANSDMNTLTQIKKSYEFLSNKWKNIFLESRDNKDYDVALEYNKQCYGDDTELNPCESRFGPNLKCKEKIFIEEGCTVEGSGYPLNNNENLPDWYKNVLNNSNSSFRTEIRKLNVESNISVLNKDEYEKKKKSALLCYGKIPEPPEPLKRGDGVELKSNGWTLKGTAIKLENGLVSVLWTSINDGSGEVTRDSLKNNTIRIKEYFGWDDIKPTHNRMRWLGDEYGRVYESNLKIIESCKSGLTYCGNSCRKIIADLKSKYPPPRDCILSEWSDYGPCDKKCDGGKQYRTRTKLYDEKRGGTCGELSDWRRCNEQPCLRDDFKNVNK